MLSMAQDELGDWEPTDRISVPERQPAFDAVYPIIRAVNYDAPVNGVIWRAVTAALDAMEPVWQERADVKQSKAYEQARLTLTSAITSYTNMANGMIQQYDDNETPGAMSVAVTLLGAIRTMEDVRGLLDEATGQNPYQVMARMVSERGEQS